MIVDREQLKQLIDQIDEPESFSGVVYLTGREGILFEYARGFANHAEEIHNRINTRFQIASGSKIFTSVAICQLIERGKLELGSQFLDYVDAEFPHYSPNITIHHLLTHTSGITSYFEEDVNPDYESVWRDYPTYRMQTPRDFLPLFREKPMKFKPGDRFDYNDGGYILLGLVIEALSGKSFHEFVETNVLRRAGMNDSGFFRSDQLPARTAVSYIRNPDGSLRSNVFAVPIIGAPDGGAYVTAADMDKFWRGLLSNQLLGEPMTSRVLAPQVETKLAPPESFYGLGVWINGEPNEIPSYFVTGFDPGVAFNSAYYPEQDVILTILGNTDRATWPVLKSLEQALKL